MKQEVTLANSESNFEATWTLPRQTRSARPPPLTLSESESQDSKNEESLVFDTSDYLPPISSLSLSDCSFTELVLKNDCIKEQDTVQALNDFLQTRGISPVRYCLRKSWQDASERTKREHLRKIRQGFTAVVNTVAPGQESEVWRAIRNTSQFSFPHSQETAENDSLTALLKAYDDAEDKSTKMQILSIFVDKFSQTELQQMLPDLTLYKINQAKRHLIGKGRGQPVVATMVHRNSVTKPKVDHFVSFIASPHLVQDVAHRMRTLRLSSGEKLKMPNVVRTMIGSRIIRQYQQYCKETQFEPLSERSLYRVLENCPAQQCKSLQGLDNTSADGLRALDLLEEIADKLSSRGMSADWSMNMKTRLRNYRRYMKGQYRFDVAEHAQCADHCCTYALSDPANKEFRKKCAHTHNQQCYECNQLNNIEHDLKTALQNDGITYCPEEVEDLTYDIVTSLELIRAWKCHLLRAVHQDKAREDALSWLSEKRVFVTQDFAMKYLPRMFKETQQEWFGKRGISWHISYCIFKSLGDATEILVFSHLFNKVISQTSSVVASVMKHTLSSIKELHPSITEARYRSDCAGTYESGGVLIPASIFENATGIALDRYDFSEPQAGKGNCDRSAAHQKAHVNRYLNEGHNVTSALEIKEALESHGGVQNCKAFVVDLCSQEKQTTDAASIQYVSFLHNYSYTLAGLRAWKAYEIGDGKLMPWKNIKDTQCSITDLNVVEKPTDSQTPINSDGIQRQKAKEKKTEDPCILHVSGLFCCPEERCVKDFMTYSGLERHLASEKHVMRDDNESLDDIVKRNWVSTFSTNSEPQVAQKSSLEAASETSCCQTSISRLSEGWALKKARKNTRFSAKIKAYLVEKFQIGESTKQKIDPTQLATEMRRALDEQGNRLFKPEECLKVQQIRSFFSRTAAAKKKRSHSHPNSWITKILTSFRMKMTPQKKKSVCKA